MKQKKILIILFFIVAGLMMSVIGYSQDEDDKKESPNDYYNNEEFKGVVDNIIKNYGGAEALKEIKYCRSDARTTISGEHINSLYETSLFCAITDTEPAVMKYRREDYVQWTYTERQPLSGITCNGKELIKLPQTFLGTAGLEGLVNTLFDTRYMFINAFNIRLTDEKYLVAYKGKQKSRELGRDAYTVELKDINPETLQERTITLYYGTSSYLLEAMMFENEIALNLPAPENAPGISLKGLSLRANALALIREHRSHEIKVNGKKQSIKCIARLSFKTWKKTGDPQKDVPPQESRSVDIKTSFDEFDESIFDKKE